MSRFFGRHGRRKARVPNIINLSRSEAQSLILNSGLTYSESSTNTSDSGLSNKVQSQDISDGSVVLYGSNISFVYYNYSAPAYYAPAPQYYAAPPQYYAAPPQYYAAPPTYYAPAGGCFVGTTLISTPSGYVQAKNIGVGSIVHSIKFNELSTDETSYTLPNWNSETFTPIELKETTITGIAIKKTVNKYLYLNGDFITEEHPIFVKSGNIYSFKPAGSVSIGDFVLRRGGDLIQDLQWDEVTKKGEINMEAEVYLFDAEDEDVIFSKNMLSHNIKL